MNLLNLLQLYTAMTGKDIFDDIILDNRINKEVLLARIVQECATFKVLYTDVNLFKYLSDNWFKQYQLVFTKLTDTMYFEYDPIHNYDRTSETTEVINNNHTNKANNSTSNTGTVSTVDSGSSKDNMSAYNVGSYSPVTETVDSNNSTVTNNLATSDKRDESTTHNDKHTVNERAYGNIGVTTTQQLITAERDAVMFTVIDKIVDMYRNTFFVTVY